MRGNLVKKLGIILIIELALIANFYLPAYSQTKSPDSTKTEIPPAGINLTLSPTFITLSTDPGKSVTTQIRVTNNNNFVENLAMHIDKFEAADNGAQPLISEMTPSDTYKNWVNFEPNEFSLAPNETKVIKVTISPPGNSGLGYYYAFVVSRVNDMTYQKQGASVSGSPAVLTLLDVSSPETNRNAMLTSFTTTHMIYEYLPATFQVTVKNSGNIFLAPVGDVFIDSMRTKNIATLKVNPGFSNVLPNTSRTFTAQWNDGFAVRVPKIENGKVVTDNKGNPEYTTKYDFSKANEFRFGKYTAHLVMVYNNGQRDVPMEATVSFWVIPWKILGAMLLIAILVLLGLRSVFWPQIKKLKRH